MDKELEKLFDEYRAINNEEKKGDLVKVADKIRARQEKLIDQEGHAGIEEVKWQEK